MKIASLFKRKRKGGGYVYYVTYFLNDKARMKSTGTSDKKLAMEIKRKLEVDLIRISQGLAPIENTKPILLSEFIETYLEDRRRLGKAEETITTDAYALGRLLKYFDDCNLASITEAAALQYRNYKLETVKPATASIELRSIRSAFNWAAEKPGEKYLHRNPFGQKGMIPPPKKRKIPLCLTPEEKKRFFAAIDDPEHEKLFKFLLLTGCRRGEAVNLQWDDIDLEQKQLTFRKTKTNKDRVVPINLELMQIIMTLDRSKPKPFNHGADWMSAIFRQYRDKAGLRDSLHLHSIRHTAATDLVRRRVPLTQIKEFLGHSSVKVTEIYIHTLPEDLRETAEALTCVG